MKSSFFNAHLRSVNFGQKKTIKHFEIWQKTFPVSFVGVSVVTGMVLCT